MELLYIHGFISSPQSFKAEQTAAYLNGLSPAIPCTVPQLPPAPAASLALLERALEAALERSDRVGLVGSSMGGFFATVLAERYDLRAVLINPAVQPQRLLVDFEGAHLNPYTGEHFVVDASYRHQLEAMLPASLTPERYWVLLQSGDETLDYREAQSYYRACRMTLEPGGDHSFVGYERHLPAIVKFLKLVEE